MGWNDGARGELGKVSYIGKRKGLRNWKDELDAAWLYNGSYILGWWWCYKFFDVGASAFPTATHSCLTGPGRFSFDPELMEVDRQLQSRRWIQVQASVQNAGRKTCSAANQTIKNPIYQGQSGPLSSTFWGPPIFKDPQPKLKLHSALRTVQGGRRTDQRNTYRQRWQGRILRTARSTCKKQNSLKNPKTRKNKNFTKNTQTPNKSAKIIQNL